MNAAVFSGKYSFELEGCPGKPTHFLQRHGYYGIQERRSCATTRTGRIVLIFPVVQLSQHVLESLRDGKADVRGILNQGKALINFLMVNLLRQKRAEHGLARTTIA